MNRAEHPLLISLAAATAAAGGTVRRPRALRGRDRLASASLFQEKLDPPAPGNATKRILIHSADYRVRQLALIKNAGPASSDWYIDPAHRVLGGFSNGGHAIAGLIDESDGEHWPRQFSAPWSRAAASCSVTTGKPFLMVYGSEKSHRRAEICDAAKAAGTKATLLMMNNVGHAFPQSEYPAVRAWLRAGHGQGEPHGAQADFHFLLPASWCNCHAWRFTSRTACTRPA